MNVYVRSFIFEACETAALPFMSQPLWQHVLHWMDTVSSTNRLCPGFTFLPASPPPSGSPSDGSGGVMAATPPSPCFTSLPDFLKTGRVCLRCALHGPLIHQCLWFQCRLHKFRQNPENIGTIKSSRTGVIWRSMARNSLGSFRCSASNFSFSPINFPANWEASPIFSNFSDAI